jgi:glutamate N-acetyltransferase/amino-acid N-acetyltransferase
MAKASAISPLAPSLYPELVPIEGVRMATAEAGIRYQNRTDVLLAVFDRGTQVAGVLTRSKCPSAAVDWCRAHLPRGTARALVVNSGNANAFTGKAGAVSVKLTAEFAATAVGASPKEILIASTGVIGEPLDARKFDGVLERLSQTVSADATFEAAKAIMTTDTYPKVATAVAKIGDTDVTLNGIAKGAGMIAPDMATMLAFVFTDAAVAARPLQAMLAQSVKTSFNAITVDGDTSTSDTLLLFATGAAVKRGAPRIARVGDPRLVSFRQALDAVLLSLAHQVVRDGEGARKFVQITVEGAETVAAAKRIALAIANSPLVKTAIAGEDANWGRIVMAVGKAGEKANRDRLDIWFGNIRVAHRGARDPNYDEAMTTALMKEAEIVVRVNVGVGKASATVWTCDLTKAYVEINGDYRS